MFLHILWIFAIIVISFCNLYSVVIVIIHFFTFYIKL